MQTCGAIGAISFGEQRSSDVGASGFLCLTSTVQLTISPHRHSFPLLVESAVCWTPGKLAELGSTTIVLLSPQGWCYIVLSTFHNKQLFTSCRALSEMRKQHPHTPVSPPPAVHYTHTSGGVPLPLDLGGRQQV
jgi:hypothetical protein